MENEKIADNKREATKKPAREASANQQPSRWERFKQWAKKDKTFTDWCIAAFTFVLAGAAIYQFIIMGSQLDTMRKDQRPWIKLSFTSSPTQASGPIGGTVQITNNGKTPARGKVTADLVIEKVNNGEEPTFDYPKPHVVVILGMVPPNDKPDVIQIERKRLAANGVNIESDPLTPDEFRDFANVKIFFVAYGIVHYSDFFGTDHWTTFCNYMSAPNPPLGAAVTAAPCSKYADVDQN